MPRCPWAATEPNITYHDEEWGVPVHDDRLLFEFLILEGAQAGLSWTTILNKRDNYRKAFDGFRPEKIARYGTRDVKRLLGDAGIVRNRLKIVAAIENAKTFLAVRKEFGTFDAYLWSFVGGKPIQNRWRRMADVPARTAESDAMSRDLQRRGFKFVGSTICYALMQATGMVNDHLVTCPRHAQLGGARRRRPRLRLFVLIRFVISNPSRRRRVCSAAAAVVRAVRNVDYRPRHLSRSLRRLVWPPTWLSSPPQVERDVPAKDSVFSSAFLAAAVFFAPTRLEDLAAARAARAADFLAAFSFFAVSAACSLCFSLASFFGSSCRRFSSRRIFFFKFFVFIILCVRLRQTRIKGSLHS